MDVKRDEPGTADEAGEGWASPGVAALERGLAVLEALRAAGQPVGLTELSARTALYKSTLLRLLASLQRCRYAVRLADGRYRLGPALPRLGQAYSDGLGLRAALRPALLRLSAETGEAASFFVREGDQRLCLDSVRGRHAVQNLIEAGTLLPLRGAAGRALRCFEGGHGPGLPVVHASFGERAAEVAAVAAPIFRSGRDLAGAMTVSGTCTRFRDEAYRAAVTASLLREAGRLTAELDGDASVY